MKTLEDELSEMPVRQSGGATCLKERDVILVAKKWDRTIKRLRSRAKKLGKEIKRLRRRETQV